MLSKISIRLKIFFSFLLLTVLVSLIFAISSYKRISHVMNHAAQKHGTEVITAFGLLVAPYIFESDYVTVKDVIQQLLEDSDIKFITITDTKGKIWFSTKNNVQQYPVTNQFYSRILNKKTIGHRSIISQGGNDHIEFVYPILAIGKVAYVVISEISQEARQEALTKRIRETVIVAILMILLSSLIAFYLAKLLTEPIKTLLNGTSELTRGNLSYRVGVTSSDEIGVLSSSFNLMTEQLEKEYSYRENAEKELKEHRDNLEKAVQQRTVELAERNKVLKGEMAERKLVEEERTQLELQLQQSKKIESVGVLAGGIAHDFNNILSAILGNVELANIYTNSESKAYPLLKEVKKASIRAKDLTQQLLTFAKGGDPIKKAASLDEIIKNSANFVLQGSSVLCDYHIPDELWPVEVDKGQIGQVIQNLIINAHQAMPEGGVIDVSCENVSVGSATTPLLLDEKYVKLTIVDSGTGIPKKHLDRIFDPYFSTKQEGSGLGLATCYSIISKHDGNIAVNSEIGKGSKFTIYLPATIQSDITDTKALSPQEETVQATQKATIMVMDDESMIREMVSQMLSLAGHTVLSTENGCEAIEIYKEYYTTDRTIDIIIMDLTIPGGMGGKESAQEILQINPKAKIIVASGYSNDPVMARYHDHGFVGSIAKPFQLEELKKIIVEVLNRN